MCMSGYVRIGLKIIFRKNVFCVLTRGKTAAFLFCRLSRSLLCFQGCWVTTDVKVHAKK